MSDTIFTCLTSDNGKSPLRGTENSKVKTTLILKKFEQVKEIRKNEEVLHDKSVQKTF